MSNALNRDQILAEIDNELQHSPQVRNWKVRKIGVVQDVLDELWTSYEWPWAMGSAPLFTYPDFTQTKGVQLTVPSAIPRRVLSLTNVSSLLGAMWNDGVTGVLTDHLEQIVGAEIGLEEPSPTDVTNGNWREGPFIVQKVKYIPPALRIWLDPRCDTGILAADGVSFHIRFPRYQLPYNFDHFTDEGAVCDERGLPLHYLHPTQFRTMSQGNSRPPSGGTGTPRYWTLDEGLDQQVPFDRFTSPAFWAGATQPAVDLAHDENMPVIQTLAATLSAGAGLRVGAVHRVAVSWFYENRHGPLSNVVELTPTGGNAQITIAAWSLLPADAFLTPDVAYGWVLGIWLSVNDGPFILQTYRDPPPNPNAGTAYVITSYSTVDPNQVQPWKRVRYEDVYNPRTRYIKLWPKPNTHKRYQLRYHKRVQPLLGPEDIPPFDPKFHRYLVYAAAARLAHNDAPIGSTPALATRPRLLQDAASVLSRMIDRYLPDGASRKQKGMLTDVVLGRFPLEAPLDYNGDF